MQKKITVLGIVITLLLTMTIFSGSSGSLKRSRSLFCSSRVRAHCLYLPALSSPVSMTMVDGKILYENGEYMTIDREKAFYDAKKAVERLYGGH